MSREVTHSPTNGEQYLPESEEVDTNEPIACLAQTVVITR